MATMALIGIARRRPRPVAIGALLAVILPLPVLLARRGRGRGDIDAVELLVARHRRLESLAGSYRRATEPTARRRIIAELRRLVSIHESVEEQLFHPAVRQSDPDGETVVSQILEQELVGRQLLRKLEEADVDSVLWDETADELVAATLEHARAEEERLFPLARRSLDGERRRRLGRAIRLAEWAAPTHPHPAAPDTPPANVLAGVPSAVLDRTRDALTRG